MNLCTSGNECLLYVTLDVKYDGTLECTGVQRLSATSTCRCCWASENCAAASQAQTNKSSVCRRNGTSTFFWWKDDS